MPTRTFVRSSISVMPAIPTTRSIRSIRSSRSAPSIPSVFDRVARFYDTELLQSAIYRPTQDHVLGVLRRLQPRRVLDVGCGTGQLTARLHAELGAALVFGCDASAGMLEQAKRGSTQVEWLHSTAEHIPLPDGSVDAVLSTEAFHFFDQPAALREFHRVLAPGGHLVVALVNPRTRIGTYLLDRNPVLPGAGHWPDRRAMRALVEGAGFRVIDQTAVRRVFGRVVPTVVTVAARQG